MRASIVFTTVPNINVARRIAKTLLQQRLVACIYVASCGESHYWWRGKIEKAREISLTIKTSKKSLPKLMRTLKKIHPYEIPEILGVCVDSGNESYMNWLAKETKANRR